MSGIGAVQLGQFQRVARALLAERCTLYRPAAGTNRQGDPVTVPVLRAADVPCALGVRMAPPAAAAGAVPSEAVVPVLRLPPDQPVGEGDWAQIPGGAWYRVVGVPPVPTHALTQAVEVEPTRAPTGAP